ncbi:transposase [Gluconobacter cerinus]|uniref:transposase n=1 Tax=Gluconobacter cerinus TaxID=38307 RepID=UPI003AB26C34
MARGDLTDQEWSMIGPLLPSERGRWVRSARDSLFLNGMLYVLRVGCLWRGAEALWQMELGLSPVSPLG